MFFGSNKFSFALGLEMYHFMSSIGKEGRQEIQQLEFGWNHDNNQYDDDYGSLLRDCLNLQRLYIGLDHRVMEDLRFFNRRHSLRHSPGHSPQQLEIWDWRGQGEDIWKVLTQLPRSLKELKVREVREVDSFGFDGRVTRSFEGLINPLYTKCSLIEKYEAELKEYLGYLTKGRRLAAVERQMKRRRVHRVWADCWTSG